MKELIDVAFNNNVKKIKKVSFSKTIDVQFGVYTEGGYKEWLTINLKPSHGWLDWIINLFAGRKDTGNGKVHKGYYAELMLLWAKFWSVIINDKDLVNATTNGILVAGRSKGAAEALLIAMQLWQPMYHNRIRVLAIDPPMVCNRQYAEYAESLLGKDNIHWTSYKNDIVTGIPPWFTFAGTKHQIGDRGLGLSFKDHREATTNSEVIYKGLGCV